MEKVITVSSHSNIMEQGTKFIEVEYPVLNKYLEAGYQIKQAIPIVKPADNSYMYSVVFHLVK